MQKSQAWPPRSPSQHFNKVIRSGREFGKCRAALQQPSGSAVNQLPSVPGTLEGQLNPIWHET